MSHPKKHHFVSQFLLRQFADEGGRHIYVFDKRTSRVFRAHISDVAAKNRLYEFSIGDLTATIEPGLAQFESKAADVLRRTLAPQSLARITVLDRTILAALVAQLLLRSPQLQAMSDDMIYQIREKIRKTGTDPDQVAQLKLLDANESKIFTAGLLTEVWQELIPVIAFKTWVLHQVCGEGILYCSDNPVVMHNDMQFGPRGNLGLAVEGIELYFPLSSTSCLAMYCPKTTAELERKYREMASCRDFMGDAQSAERREIVEKLFNAFRTGESAPFDCSNVEFVNSLQVWSADRYVYAAQEDFALAAQMVKKNPRLRFGPRSSIA
jgi:hypothetical protein